MVSTEITLEDAGAAMAFRRSHAATSVESVTNFRRRLLAVAKQRGIMNNVVRVQASADQTAACIDRLS
ncbi:hypothetical protein ABTJ59_19980, partial [Acinetobacter baumannii]